MLTGRRRENGPGRLRSRALLGRILAVQGILYQRSELSSSDCSRIGPYLNDPKVRGCWFIWSMPGCDGGAPPAECQLSFPEFMLSS